MLSFFKTVKGFDPRFATEGMIYPSISNRVLNPLAYADSYSDKGMLCHNFSGLKQPTLLARNVHGTFLDSNNKTLQAKDAIDLVRSADVDLIIKPSIDTSAGAGVKKIKKGSLSHNDAKQLLSGYKSDFVIQHVLEQSPFTAQFNPTSLNTFRVSTLYLNGRWSLCASVFRIGGEGQEADNVGLGGCMVGVTHNGELMEKGYPATWVAVTERNGLKLRGQQVPEWNKVLEFARDLHMRMPVCAFVGWDIALDRQNTPTLIEANMTWPSVSYEQMSCGPVFGDRTDEVIDFVKRYRR